MASLNSNTLLREIMTKEKRREFPHLSATLRISSITQHRAFQRLCDDIAATAINRISKPKTRFDSSLEDLNIQTHTQDSILTNLSGLILEATAPDEDALDLRTTSGDPTSPLVIYSSAAFAEQPREE